MEVLIVDDERHMTEYLKHLIEWERYGFEKVTTINKALSVKEHLTNESPALMLVDIRMPEVSGLQLTQMIYEKKLPTKVVIISGFTEFEYAQKAIHLEVMEYLVKPVLKKDLIAVLQKLNLTKTNEKRPTQETEDPMVQLIKQYINNHLDEAITLDMIGNHVHLSPKYLSHFFKKKTGINVLTYLTDKRMAYAANLLKTSDLQVQEIGEMIGYKKTQYFIALFKKCYGLTPQQYRIEQLIVQKTRGFN